VKTEDTEHSEGRYGTR